MVETYKILNNIDKVQYEQILPLSQTTTRGHSMKLYKKNCRTNVRKYSFSQRIVDEWNKIPKKVIDSKTINTFKSQLNEFKSLRNLVISAPSQIGTQVIHFGPKLDGTWSNRHLPIVNSAPMYIYFFICTLENYNFIDILVINI